MSVIIVFLIAACAIFYSGYQYATERSPKNKLLTFPDRALPCASAIKQVTGYRGKGSICHKAACTMVHWNERPLTSLMQIIEKLRYAQKSIFACMYQMTNTSLADVIIYKRKQGLKVVIVTDQNREINENDQIARLKEAGISVMELRLGRSDAQNRRPLMHNKFVVIDSKVVIHGSLNWTQAGILYNQETVVISEDPALAREFEREMGKLQRNILKAR